MIYELMKRIIERGEFDKTDILVKLDVYLAYDRITKAHYEELCNIVKTN